MVGQVDDGLLVGCSHVFDVQLVVIVELLDDGDPDFARKSFLAVGTDIFQHQRLVVHLQGVPDLCVESFLSPVQTVGAVVDGQLVFLAMELETSFADAVAIAADKRGKVGLGRIDDILYVVVALDDIGPYAILVRYHNGNDCASIVGDGHLVALVVPQNEKIRLLSVHGGLEVLTSQATYCLCLRVVRHIRFLVLDIINAK